MPFVSSGRTLEFKNISPEEYTLLDLLKELANKNFVGRIAVDGSLEGSSISIYIDILKDVIVALEVNFKGKTLRGQDAVEIFRKALREVRGIAEVIQLTEEKIRIDLRDAPDARVSIPIPSKYSIGFEPKYIHIGAEGMLDEVVNILKLMTKSICMYIEGVIGNSNCNSVLKGDICPDIIDVQMVVNRNEIEVTSMEDFQRRMKELSANCKLIEAYGNKIS